MKTYKEIHPLDYRASTIIGRLPEEKLSLCHQLFAIDEMKMHWQINVPKPQVKLQKRGWPRIHMNPCHPDLRYEENANKKR